MWILRFHLILNNLYDLNIHFANKLFLYIFLVHKHKICMKLFTLMTNHNACYFCVQSVWCVDSNVTHNLNHNVTPDADMPQTHYYTL